MDGLRRVAGADSEVTIGERTYRVVPPTKLSVRAELEAHVVAQRPNLLEEVAKSLDKVPAKYHERMLDSAMRQMEKSSVATEAEVRNFLNTFEGTAYLFWLMVREHQPEVDSLAKALEICSEIPLQSLQSRLDKAAGFGDVKKSAGPEEQAAAPPETASASPGPSSTAA